MQKSTNKSNDDSLSDFSQSASGSTQARYKKALKQINKLVVLTNNLKKQNQSLRESYRRLEDQHQALLAKHSQMMSKISHKTAEFGGEDREDNINQSNTKNVLQCRFRQSQFSQEISQVLPQSKVRTVKIQIQNSGPTKQQFQQKISYLKDNIAEYQKKLLQKDNKIEQINLVLQKKVLQAAELESRCGDFNQKLAKYQQINRQLSQKLKQRQKGQEQSQENKRKSSTGLKQQDDIANKKLYQQLIRQKKKVQQLEQKLHKTQDWSKKVEIQYEQMRKSMITQQTISPDFSASVRVNNSMNSNTTSNYTIKKIRTDTDIRSQTGNNFNYSYFNEGNKSKGKVLSRDDDEISRLKRQYNDKKNKYKNQIVMLKQQIAELNNKMFTMRNFIEKQQFYIENYVDRVQKSEQQNQAKNSYQTQSQRQIPGLPKIN